MFSRIRAQEGILQFIFIIELWRDNVHPSFYEIYTLYIKNTLYINMQCHNNNTPQEISPCSIQKKKMKLLINQNRNCHFGSYYINLVISTNKQNLMQSNPVFCFYLKFIMFVLFMITSNCYNLSCNGRSVYSKITLKNDVNYTPQFGITFGIRLQANQTLTQNLTISLTADNQCIPNSSQFNFNFTESECKPFLKWISCGRKVYLNCTKEYQEKDKQISFTAHGKVSYLNQSLTCQDTGQIIVWQKDTKPTQQTDDIGLIIGFSVGGAILLGVGIFAVWRCRKNKKKDQLLNQEE